MAPLPDVPEAARRDLEHLAARDPDLARIEVVAGPLPWRRRAPGFAGLLQAIVGQQISAQAAAAIWRRLCAGGGPPDPAALLALADEELRICGLSRPKIAHARALAAAFAAGSLSEPGLRRMTDAEAVAAISAVRGLGVWSAEIYLLFALERPDVFPAGDLALAAAVTALKGLPARPTPAALRQLAEPWRPWRALAARLLWHYWRHHTGRPTMDD